MREVRNITAMEERSRSCQTLAKIFLPKFRSCMYLKQYTKTAEVFRLHKNLRCLIRKYFNQMKCENIESSDYNKDL